MSTHPRTNSPLKSSSGTSHPLNEVEKEREKRLAEQRSINALKLQRKQRLLALITKRKSNLLYLKVITFSTDVPLVFSAVGLSL
jgi:hypothetical protein